MKSNWCTRVDDEHGDERLDVLGVRIYACLCYFNVVLIEYLNESIEIHVLYV